MHVKLGAGVLAALAISTVANASIILNFSSPPVPVGGGLFQYTYTAQLSPDQKINSASNPMFVNFFDVGNVSSLTATPLVSGITVSAFQEMTSTQAPLQAAPDSASINNVRVNINGSFTPSGTTAVSIFSLVFNSPSSSTVLDYQSGAALKNAPGDPSDGSAAGNTVRIEGPSGAVPEPASMGLIGSGLVGLAFLIRRRKA